MEKDALKLTDKLDSDDVLSLLYTLAEKKQIVIVQAYTEEHFGLKKGSMPDVGRIQDVLSNCDFIDVRDEIREVIDDLLASQTSSQESSQQSTESSQQSLKQGE